MAKWSAQVTGMRTDLKPEDLILSMSLPVVRGLPQLVSSGTESRELPSWWG